MISRFSENIGLKIQPTIFFVHNRNLIVKNYLKIFLAVVITIVSAFDINASSCYEKHFGAERSECSSEKNTECFGNENIGRPANKVLLNVSNVLTLRLKCCNSLPYNKSSFSKRIISPMPVNVIANTSLLIVSSSILRI
jgi:hypothetical protein